MSDEILHEDLDLRLTIMKQIHAERARQVLVEGWTIEHDNGHKDGEMAQAAAAYCSHAGGNDDFTYLNLWPWNWSQDWFKPTTPRRDLIKAAALIMAEVERLDRLDPPAPRWTTHEMVMKNGNS